MDSNIPGKIYLNHIYWMKSRGVKCTQLNFTSLFTLSSKDSLLLGDCMRSLQSCLKGVHLIHNSRSVTHTLLNLLASHKVAVANFSVDLRPTMLRRELREAKWDEPMREILLNSVSTLTELNMLLRFEWHSIMVQGAQFHALRKLTVHGCDDADLLTICAAAPNLTYIQLIQPDCSDIGFEEIGRHCCSLEYFNLMFDEHVVNIDHALETLAQGCNKLKRIELHDCEAFTDVGITAVATHCTQLEHLLICTNDNIKDASLIALAHSNCAKIMKLLHLQFCADVTGSGMVEIAMHCPALCTLELKALFRLAIEQLEMFIPYLKNLTHFKLWYCDVGWGS